MTAMFVNTRAIAKQRLNSHINIEHKGIRYECHECDGVFKGKEGVRKHVERVHKGLKVDCDMCELKLSSTSSLSTHKKNVHFKPTVYGAKTLTETIFSMMIESNSGWRCRQCGKESKNKHILKMHIESEHMGIAHTCEMCGRTYKTEDTFRHHLTGGACKAKSLVVID